jgi:hypothetical protein
VDPEGIDKIGRNEMVAPVDTDPAPSTDHLTPLLRQKEEKLASEVERARLAYLERLPPNNEWISIARHQARLDKVRPPLGYRAVSFALDEMLEDRAIEFDSAAGNVRRIRPRSR